MIIVLSSDPDGTSTVSLDEPDDCTRFHVSAFGLNAERVGEVLAEHSLGTMRGSEAYIDPAVIEGMTGERVSHDWPDRFAGMLAYAEKKGWLDADGAVQAHIEWT